MKLLESFVKNKTKIVFIVWAKIFYRKLSEYFIVYMLAKITQLVRIWPALIQCGLSAVADMSTDIKAKTT